MDNNIMGIERITELHDNFMMVIKKHPSLVFVALTQDNLYIYDRNTDEFVSKDGKERVNIFYKPLYHFIKSKSAFIMCLISFDSIDDVLDYISENRIEEDYQQYIENVNRTDTKM